MIYLYTIENIRVIDGDTVDCDIDLGFDVWLRKQRIRLYGIDAPETRTRDLAEKEAGLKAKQFLEDSIGIAHQVQLQSNEFNRGKFGRILGSIMTVDPSGISTDLNQAMINLELVKPYFGGNRGERG